jgi:subtilisin family serine protease
VRQIVPDARVLALRVMHSDGVVYEGDLLCALRLLAERVAVAGAGAQEDGMAAMVDVVSLSLGYFDESAGDVSFSTGLRSVLDLLLSLGVAVVAAAGNYSTSRKFYPAAFTEPPAPAGQVPLISVGALNPNGSKALFSDGGHWISAWAPGAAVVSTFPVDLNGSRSPELRMPAHPANEMPPGVALPADREALDPDDYSGGFALWSGTSFSAPLVAAHITRSLLDGAADPALGLGLPGPQAATGRALASLRSLGWQG